MLKILLVRHGETDWNREHRIMGAEAIPINVNGRRQAKELRQAIQGLDIDAVYTSPILRAKETAQILFQGRSLVLQDDDRLVEVNYGDWTGRTFEEIRRDPGYIPYYLRMETPIAPNGDTLQQVQERAMDFFQDVQVNCADQTVVVVSHADWIKCMLMQILEIPFQSMWRFNINNLSVSVIEASSQGSRVICINQRASLVFLNKLASSF